MAREEWKKTDDYEKKNREAYGIFTEWPTPSEIVEGRSKFRAMGENKDKRKKEENP